MLYVLMAEGHKTKPLPVIIAVSGKIGCGKDYTTEHFLMPALERYGIKNVSRMAFADHIKINVASRMGIPIEQCLVSQKSPELRRELQLEGTERGRDIYGPDIWVQTLENWVRLRATRDQGLDAVLITDCRFPNEAAWIEANDGLLIRVDAPTRNSHGLDLASYGGSSVREKIANHRSETALDNHTFKYRVNNEPGQNSSEQVNVVVDQYFAEKGMRPVKRSHSE